LYHNGTYHLVLNGNDAGTDYKIFVNASNTEVRKAQSSFTVKSSEATLNSKIIELDQFSGTLVSGENITISGKDHNGNAISGQLAITSNTKLTHLISEINDAFDGRATATFVNGEIRLTDHTCGTSQMELTLTYNPGSGSTTLSVPTISRLTQGGITPANLAGFAGSDFTTTQTAQDSKIRVDGYPSTSAVEEVQRLTTTNRATAGNFTLTYDGYTTAAIAYDATTAQIQAALVALPNVSSGDITVSGSRLTVNGGVTVFTFLNTLGDVSLISINPSGLTPSANSNYVMSEYTKGSDGWISRSSNTVDDVVQGVTLHLHDTGTVEVNLTRDIESVKQKLDSMVTAYNAVVAYTKEKTGYNETLKTAGVLMGDYTVSSIESALYMPLIAQTKGFVEDIDTFLMSGQIGLELDGDGMLSFDSDTFDEAISEDYLGVLDVIGADKTGSSTSNTIAFYSASSKWTTAGTYNVEVTISGGAISSAGIKLSTEATYRDATVAGNVIMGNSTFDDNGDPVYPENGLYLTVDLSQAGTFTATVRVKQGFAGTLEDALDRTLKTTTGSVQLDQDYVDENIDHLQDKIDAEEERLTRVKKRLVARYAQLESTLTLLQNQMSALGLGSSS
jgi:flagellar capping protein FliD